MFDISIRSNLKQFGLTVKEFETLTPRAVRQSFYSIGKDLTADARKYIKEPKHGRVYITTVGRSMIRRSGVVQKKLKILRRHKASAPGEAPAKLTGVLNESVYFKVTGTDRLDFGVSKMWGCDYAKYLEYKNLIAMTGGTASNSIAPRPFISRSFRENRNRMVSRMRQAVEQSLKT